MKKKQKLFCLLLIPFLTIALANTPTLSSTTAKIYLSPSITYEEEDASLEVDVKIADVINLYSWQVNMSFDPSVLEFVNVTEGDFLMGQPEGTTPLLRDDHAEEGWVLFGWVTIGKYLGVTGSGTLATVDFGVAAMGESGLNLTNPQTILIEINPPPVPPGGQMFPELPYTAENGLFINLVDPPKAEFAFTPGAPNINESITFDASASYATPPRDIIRYEWDFGDGTTQIYVKDVNLTDTTTHTYTESGIYTVTLTVVDNASATELVQSIYGTTTMPHIWYELYSTTTAGVNIKFGRDVAVTHVIASPDEVTEGEMVSINVTVLNKGADPESFSVTTYYGNNLIETKQVTDLAAGTEQSLIFDWDTTDVPGGDYQVWAEASLAADGYPDDNSHIDGTVKVNPPPEPFPIWIVVAVIGVVVVVAVVFVYIRARRSSPSR